tara:strand:- start:86 stop:337 length:252 start_codon:yes stop_codon:yes gene_type:complete
MAEYLKFATPSGALTRSGELWEETLGRPADGVTTHLYSVTATATESYMMVTDDGALLTDDEKAALDSEEDYKTWEEANFPGDS